MNTSRSSWGARCDCHIPWGWRVRHSLWTLAAPLGLGALSWVSFVYLAARVRRGGLILIAAAFTLAGLAAGVWTTVEPEGEQLSGLLLVFTWAAAIVTVIILNSSYARWRWRRDRRCTCGYDEYEPRHGAWGEQPAYRRASAEPASATPSPARQTGPDAGAQESTLPVIQDVVRPSQLTVAPPVSSRFQGGEAGSQEPDRGSPLGESGSLNSAPASTPSAPTLGLALVSSAAYAQQKSVVRVVLNDDVVSRVIDEMAAAPGGRLSTPKAAAALDVPLSRVGGGITCLARQLNVDGYGIVRREGDFVVLDAPLLREQFLI